MSKIEIAKERTNSWPSRGWYVSGTKGAHYLSPTLKWQLGAICPENCFVKTRREARKRLKAWKLGMA